MFWCFSQGVLELYIGFMDYCTAMRKLFLYYMQIGLKTWLFLLLFTKFVPLQFLHINNGSVEIDASILGLQQEGKKTKVPLNSRWVTFFTCSYFFHNDYLHNYLKAPELMHIHVSEANSSKQRDYNYMLHSLFSVQWHQ